MKFPSRLALAVLVTGFSLPAFLAWSAPAKAAKTAAKTTVKKGKKAPVVALTASDTAESDSLRHVDSLARYAPVGVLDSLWHLDSLRRIHPLRGRDSIVGVRIDSARRVESAKAMAAESLRKADSVATAGRTWFVAKPRDFSQTPIFSAQLQARLILELRRSGRVRTGSVLDTNTTFDGTWKAARASGAGKMLYTAIYAGPAGSRNAMAWVFDLADGHKLDSAHGESVSGDDRSANELARAVIRILRPSMADSACQADSLLVARRVWAVAEPRNWTSDSAISCTVRDSMISGMRRSTRASWMALVVPDSCHKRHCTDSAASARGIERVVHSVLSRLPDSTWVLSLWVARSSDDSLTDSLRVADPVPARLVERAMKELLPWPASCPRCISADSRTVWSFVVSGDTNSLGATTALSDALKAALQARTDRQFLSLQNPLLKDSIIQDSAARSLGVRKLALATLSGSDSFWVLRVQVRDLRTGSFDTLVLRRGGPAARVLPWFARHLAAFGAEGDPPCGNACRLDSLRSLRTIWAVAPPTGTDTAVNGIMADRLMETFLARKMGRIIALPDKLPCLDMPCLDSVAAARSIQKVVWSQVSRKKDSLWTLSARVSDVATDEWTDSVQVSDTGALETISPLSSQLWEAIAPKPRACDSCISLDTLEAALAIVAPAWVGAPDSFRTAFRDSLSRILSHQGPYQVLDTKRVDSLAGNLDSVSLARLRCKVGAAYVLRSSASLENEGWRVKASVVEISSGKTVASVETLDKNTWPGRAAEMAPWVANKLLGLDTTATPPKSTHSRDVPWGRMLLLAVPLVIGVWSVVYHW